MAVYDELKIMELMDNIEYGWIDKNNQKHNTIDDKLEENYILQSPDETMKSEIGICTDQVELERYYFNFTDLKAKTYCLTYINKDKYLMHSFLVFEKDNKYHWFEHSWSKFKGIHEYNSINELLLDVKNKFIKLVLEDNYVDKALILHEYTKPNYHITIKEFYNHCDYGKYIDFTKLN